MNNFNNLNCIDLHTHILPENIPNFKEKFGYGGFIKLETAMCKQTKKTIKNMLLDDNTFFRTIDANCWDPAVRIEQMKQLEVERQVLSTVPVMFSYWAKGSDTLDVSQFLNNHLHSIVKYYQTYFTAMGTIPMQDPTMACLELERIAVDLHFPAVQIGTNIQGQNLGEKKFWPIYEVAQKHNISIFIHPWNMMGQEQLNDYWLSWLVGMPAETARAACSLIFSGVLDAFPKLKIGLAHGGGSFPVTLGRIEQGYHVRPDLCAKDCKLSPMKYKNRFILDTLVHDENTLKFLVNEFGAEHLALGSDYPFPLGEARPGELIRHSSLFSVKEKEWMLRKTALKFLNIAL